MLPRMLMLPEDFPEFWIRVLPRQSFDFSQAEFVRSPFGWTSVGKKFEEVLVQIWMGESTYIKASVCSQKGVLLVASLRG